MIDLAERLLNLAMYLARNPQGVTAEQCREQVDGYTTDPSQNEAAFKRMLERDKEMLRETGMVIETRPEGNAPSTSWIPPPRSRPRWTCLPTT